MSDTKKAADAAANASLQEEMDAIPVIGEDPMLRFQFVDVSILTCVDV